MTMDTTPRQGRLQLGSALVLALSICAVAAIPLPDPGSAAPGRTSSVSRPQGEGASASEETSPSTFVATSTVGMRTLVKGIALPAPERFPRPMEDPGKDVVLLEVLSAVPMGEGDNQTFQYELAYTAFEPGQHDLADHFVDAEGNKVTGLRPMLVDVTAVLPAGPAEPLPLSSTESKWPGGYETAMWVLGGFWVVGLLVGIFGFRKRAADDAAASGPVKRSLADRLQPLVEGAMGGDLSEGRQAELERLLMDYWRKRLDLLQEEPASAVRKMKAHPEAGELLTAVEQWLHRPRDGSETQNAAGADADTVAKLLAPYRNVADPEAPAPGGNC